MQAHVLAPCCQSRLEAASTARTVSSAVGSNAQLISPFVTDAAMSPAVLAKNEREAITKGKALYDIDGLADFSVNDSGERVLARAGS
ncbi:hypothetical protein ACVWZ4_001252 [Bradyrhizobium sp. USDA 4472]